MVLHLIRLIYDQTDGMQSYGLACAGSQMAHNVLPHLQHIAYIQNTYFLLHKL